MSVHGDSATRPRDGHTLGIGVAPTSRTRRSWHLVAWSNLVLLVAAFVVLVVSGVRTFNREPDQHAPVVPGASAQGAS